MAWLREFWSDDGGQGITEYACVLAFTSLIIIMVFSITQGSFADAIFSCFSRMAEEIDRLCTAANQGT